MFSRRHLRRTVQHSGLALAGMVVLASAGAAHAGAAPLTETEPNDNVLYANGPVPAEGYVRTKNVTDDTDYFKVQLKGGRQVSATSVSLTSGICSSVNLTRADGDWTHTFDAGSTPDKYTWTTPRDDTVYIGRMTSGTAPVGCQNLISFAPADAVTVTLIADPPNYDRGIDTVAAPAKVSAGGSIAIGVTGRAVDQEKVVAWLVDGACGASPSTTTDPGSSSKTESDALAKGAFTKSLTLKAPDAYRPQLNLCVWVVDTLSKLQPLLRQQTIQVGEPPVRTLTVTAASSAAPSASFSVSTSGIAATDDGLVVRLVAGACGESPAVTVDAASSQKSATSLSSGSYSEMLSVTTPSSSAQLSLCVWLTGASGVAPLLFQQAVSVVADAPTATTITFRKRRYSGRVTSPQVACYRGVRVELRRRGKATKSYGSTVTRQDGTWTIRRGRISGKIYAYVPLQDSRGYRCNASQSLALSKRH